MFSGLTTAGLGFVAGILSTLSPCVLPLLPILAGSALSVHRRGPLALAGGLALSYTLLGLFVAGTGTAVGLDPGLVRNLGAVLLIAFGVLLLSASLQQRFAAAAAVVSAAGQPLLERIAAGSLGGQVLLGVLLGAVWSPCVGPTLGAAIVLAGQGGNLFHAGLVMASFGVGAALPLLLLGNLSQQAVHHYKARLASGAAAAKLLLGGLLVLMGLLVLSGLDKIFEAWTLNHAPEWLIRLTTAV